MAKLLAELKQNKPFESLEDEVFINIIRTAEVFNRKHTEFLKAFELTPPQFNVLRILRGAEPDGLICREIGERMVSFDPDVTKLLDRLEARDLVVRERQQKDRRVITVRISAAGLELLKKIDRPILDFTDSLLGHLGEKKLRALNELVEEAREKII
ncbi:MAG: MarR family transcriptional regulator [Acidobacteriota bacterium]|nr:MarR family transcriptional regulator [Acidobacteriota bacterium]